MLLQSRLTERAEYFDYYGRAGGHASIGVSGDDLFWYLGADCEKTPTWYLAEGSAAGEFDTYILVVNPTDSKAEIRATFMKPDGETVVKDYEVDAHARFTIDLRNIEELRGYDVSTRVQSTNGVKVATERAQYFNYNGETGGHDSIAANGD